MTFLSEIGLVSSISSSLLSGMVSFSLFSHSALTFRVSFPQFSCGGVPANQLPVTRKVEPQQSNCWRPEIKLRSPCNPTAGNPKNMHLTTRSLESAPHGEKEREEEEGRSIKYLPPLYLPLFPSNPNRTGFSQPFPVRTSTVLCWNPNGLPSDRYKSVGDVANGFVTSGPLVDTWVHGT